MKTRMKIIVGVVLSLIVAGILVLFAYPQVAATLHSYFDVNNGRMKVECISFGRVYRESIEKTEYSKLLKRFGFEELPTDWKPANSAELGIKRLLDTQHVHHEYAKVPSDAKTFAAWLQLQEKMSEQERREKLNKFRTLVREGTPDQVHEYVNDLQQTARE
jgi:hypothetical protein